MLVTRKVRSRPLRRGAGKRGGVTHELSIQHADSRYETKSFTFPGGEIQVSIPELPDSLDGDVTVHARLQSAEALVRLLLTSEILDRRCRSARKRLVVPYFPYARQDRVMQPNEAFSLKAVARLINSLGFDEVVTCDPHSDVTPALVENIRVIPQERLIAVPAEMREEFRPVIVAPDAGAAKKAFRVAQRFDLPMVTASKVRDVNTGQVTRTELHASVAIAGADVLIVDDICDGGRTFVELAKVLRAAGTARVYLYVTHGIFSQGLGVFDGLIDGVFTTDSFLSRDVESPHQSPVPLHVHRLSFDGAVCR